MPKGRPKLDPAGSVSLTVRLPPPVYDAVYTKAQQARQTVAAFVRDTLHKRTRK